MIRKRIRNTINDIMFLAALWGITSIVLIGLFLTIMWLRSF
jgi:hypothetical protein